MSVGDVELTEEEMEDLVNSKSGLIQLRGKWVMADKQVVSQVTGYMDALREKSLARKKKELEQLAATAEMAKQLEEPGWEALMADVERRRQEFNEGGEEHEQVTVAELRELALESCLLYTSPSPRDATLSRMPSSA